MKPGKMTPEQLVTLLAKKAMGWEKVKTVTRCGEFIGIWRNDERWRLPWNPLKVADNTDMVVDALAREGWEIVETTYFDSEVTHTAVTLLRNGTCIPEQDGPGRKRAVCLAAAMATAKTKGKKS